MCSQAVTGGQLGLPRGTIAEGGQSAEELGVAESAEDIESSRARRARTVAHLVPFKPEGRLEHTPDFQVCLKPSGIHVLLAQAA